MGKMTLCGRQLRKLGGQGTSMEHAAGEIVEFFYDSFRQDAHRSLALVRFFKTHPLGDLDPDLRTFARSITGDDYDLHPDTKCLVLLATAGEHPDWNDRRTSLGHQAIPLASEELVVASPMISGLVRQFGLEPSNVIHPSQRYLRDIEETSFNVFLVEDALSDPCIPAKTTFVEPYGIRSVLGFGGMLPSGALFSVIMFSRVDIDRQTADLFKPLALCVKTALLEHDGAPLFA